MLCEIMADTCSEELFERFLEVNEISFRRIPPGSEPTPDYAVKIDGAEIIFEVKEIAGNRQWKSDEVHGETVGNRIRQKIKGSKAQIQKSAMSGMPVVLLIFNNHDPLQLYGIEDHDFKAAMYGEDTLLIDRDSGQVLDRFNGKRSQFQFDINTSFSALARMRQQSANGVVSITVFPNEFAAVPIAFDKLPRCFEVKGF